MIPELLQRPAVIVERCREPGAQASVVRPALIGIVVGGIVFGAAVGSFRGPVQALASALKIPIATLLTLAVCAPGFAGMAGAFGRAWSVRETIALTLTAGARASLVLLALGPLLWLVIGMGASYYFVRDLATLAYALGGLSGLAFMLRAIGRERGRLATAVSFVALFLVAGAQTAWLLRPYLGDPRDANPPASRAWAPRGRRRRIAVPFAGASRRAAVTTPFLLGVYAAAGIVAGYHVYRRATRRDLGTLCSVIAAVVVWPLWAPFALQQQRASPTRGPLATRICAALWGRGDRDTPLVMDAIEARRLLVEIEHAEVRLGDIDARLAAARRALVAEDVWGTNESRARAELREQTITQLEELRRREHRALVDLAEVCELLRAQTTLAELGTTGRAEELRDELWARVQALSELATVQRFSERDPLGWTISSTRT